MSKLTATRTAQNVCSATFTFNAGDTILDSAGSVTSLTATAGCTADVINLPPGSIVVGGAIVTETAFDTAGYDVAVGDSASATRYLAATDVKGTGLVALVPTGYRNVDGLNLRLTILTDDAITVGKATVRVDYIIDGRAADVVSN
jgi:hypothetical protein